MFKGDHNHCNNCGNLYQDHGPSSRSWSFGVVCKECSDKAGRTTQRHNRRTNKKAHNAKHRLTKFDWLAVLYKHDFSCAHCKVHATETLLTLDHKNPLAVGGPNGYWNIQPLCDPCHQSKDNMSPGSIHTSTHKHRKAR